MDDRRYIEVYTYPAEDVDSAKLGDDRRWIKGSSESARSVTPCLAFSRTYTLYSAAMVLRLHEDPISRTMEFQLRH